MKMIGALLDLNNKPVSQLLWFRRKAIAHRYDLNVPECRQNLWTCPLRMMLGMDLP